MKTQLSISMLASDRKETLKKCLDSLRPILDTIPSELIVVFTGKDKEVLELAKQYTNQVIPFTWCDDFSAARNAGLERACGEWFMYLDDDEWFEDTKEICEFFQSGEYQKYCSAAYIIRNYGDWEGKTYVDSTPKRMAKLSKELQFRYAIHEELYPMLEPVKYLKDFVHHFGYVENVKKGDDGETPKFKRNLPLLLNEIERNKESKKLYMQVAQEYRSIRNYKKAEEYCQKGLELIRNHREGTRIETWLLAYYPLFIAQQNDRKRMMDEAEYILEHDRPNELLRAWLYILIAKVCMPLKMYEKGLEYVKKFYDVISYLDCHEELWNIQDVLDVQYQAVAGEKKKVFILGLDDCVLLKDDKMAQEILSWIIKEKSKTDANDYYGFLDSWKKEHKEKEDWILECFGRIDTEDVYVQFQKALYAEKHGKIDELKQAFEKCLAVMNPYLRYQMAFMAIRNEFEISQLIAQIDLETWESYAKAIVEHIEKEKLEEFSDKARKALIVYPLYYAVIQRFLLEKKMWVQVLEGEELAAAADEYAKSIVGYYKNLYKEGIFREPMWFCLPSECRFALLLVEALENQRKGNISESIQYLKRATEEKPDMANILKRLAKYLRQMMSRPQEQVADEFTALGEQVKQSVREMIQKRQYKEAKAVVEQLKTLLPDDMEVLELKLQILKEELDSM